MLIKIDTRETALLQQMHIQTSLIPVFSQLKIASETLPIGDIIINDGKEDRLIIERKSVNDLLSSIKDGRYEEQSYRLNGLNHHNHNIIYLIEGDINKANRFKTNNKIEKLTLYSAMFSLNYYKGFSVFRSFDLEETANVICNMAYKLGKETSASKKPYYHTNLCSGGSKLEPIPEQSETTSEEETNNDDIDPEDQPSSGSAKDYVSVIKKVKKENITVDNIGEIMLCQIPGISSVTALAVLEKYQSLPQLIKELEQNENALKDISYTNSKGQVRKISKTCTANIVKFLLKK